MFQPAHEVTLPYEFYSSDNQTHVSLTKDGSNFVMDSKTCPWSIFYLVRLPQYGDEIHVNAGRMFDYYEPGELGGLCGDCNGFPDD